MKKAKPIIKNDADQAPKRFWGDLWDLIQPSHKTIKKVLIWTVLLELAKLGSPFILKLFIDKVNHFSMADANWLIALALIFFLAERLSAVIVNIKDKRTFDFLIDMEYYLPIKAQDKLLSLNLGYHEKENTGNKIIKIERGLNKIVDLLGNLSWEVVPTLIQLMVTLVVLFVIDWRLGLSLLIYAPVFIFLTYNINRSLYPLRRQRHRDYEKASGILGQAIMNINAVQSFVQEKTEGQKLHKVKEVIKKNELSEWYQLLHFILRRNLIIDLGRLTIILLGIYLVAHSILTIGAFVFVFTLTEKAYFSLFRLSRFYDRLEEGKEGVNRFLNLFKARSEVANDGKLIPRNVVGEIRFKNISFTYQDSPVKALNKVDFKVNAGCFTAIVGPSGGGKTTIARLIYRHYDPQAGEILLDDKNIKEYDLYAWRKILAIVPQEVEIFDVSVRDNIAYANPKASLAEIQAAARIANAEEFILKLKDGYGTLVGERGIKLSGGQRQRIGIARAVLANPRILVFDEATSNLDSYSEKLIQAAMDKISKNRTMIVIAHRFSTIKRADKIIVLKNGRVVEEGSHFELADLEGGLYSELLHLQAMGEVK
jgi:ATP-binding cassette subfamily B protein/subfamily B ATP-binding cassette protein MsbA